MTVKNNKTISELVDIADEQALKVSRYTSLMLVLDENLNELGCNLDVINQEHPNAHKVKKLISTAIDLSGFLLDGHEGDVRKLADMLSTLNMKLALGE